MERAIIASVAAFVFGALVGVVARSAASAVYTSYRARCAAADDALRKEAASLDAELSELDAAVEKLAPFQPMGDSRVGVFPCEEFVTRAVASSRIIEGLLSDDGGVVGSFGSAVECAEAFAAFLTKAEQEAASVTASACASLAAAGGGSGGAAAEALARTVAATLINDAARWRALGDAAVAAWTKRLIESRAYKTADALLVVVTRERLLDLFSLHAVLSLWVFACDANVCFSVARPRAVQFDRKVHVCAKSSAKQVVLVGAELNSRSPRNTLCAPATPSELRRVRGAGPLRTFSLPL